MLTNWKGEPIAVAFFKPGCVMHRAQWYQGAEPPETRRQSGCVGLLETGAFPCWYPSVCLKSPLIYFLHSIVLGFVCLGSGLKGHVVSLGLLSVNACLYFTEVQAVLFIYLFIYFLQGDKA